MIPCISLDLFPKRSGRREAENQVSLVQPLNNELFPQIASFHVSRFEGRRPTANTWSVAFMERLPKLELTSKVEVGVDIAGGEVFIFVA